MLVRENFEVDLMSQNLMMWVRMSVGKMLRRWFEGLGLGLGSERLRV